MWAFISLLKALASIAHMLWCSSPIPVDNDADMVIAPCCLTDADLLAVAVKMVQTISKWNFNCRWIVPALV